MSQNDFTLANQGFPSMRTDMNSAFQALASNNSGGTAPTTTFAHQWWYDTTNSLLMIRNAGNTAFEEFSAGGGGIVYVEKTANYTAAAGEGIIADTSAGSWTLTLPATPASGDVVVIADGADWATNNLTVGRNGNTIEGDSSNLILNIGGVSVTFIYASNNWQIYTQMGAASGTVVTTTAAQTLTNKIIGSSQLTGALPAIDGSALTSLTSANLTGALPAISGAALTGLVPKYALFQDQKANGTGGGSVTAQTYTTRDLNTTVNNNITGCTLSANLVTLLAGTYYYSYSASAFKSDQHHARLYNTTDSTQINHGTGQFNQNTSTSASTNTTGEGMFTIASTKVISVQHWLRQASGGTEALGTFAGTGGGTPAFCFLYLERRDPT